MPGLPRRLGVLALPVVLALTACGDVDAPGTASSPMPTISSDIATSPSAVGTAAGGQQCVDETVDQSLEDAVGSAGHAAWLIEHELPPPLRAGGVHSGTTSILLDGDPVGEVGTEEVEDGGFLVIGYEFCVPAHVDLSRIDLEATVGGDWKLVEATPDLGLPADAEMGLAITGDTAGGWAVCNEYNGLVAAGPDGTWRISRLFFTEAGCGQPESDYFDAFGATSSWSLDGSELVLDGPAGTLRYAPATP